MCIRDRTSDLEVISAIDENENKENIITNMSEEVFIFCFLVNFYYLTGTNYAVLAPIRYNYLAFYNLSRICIERLSKWHIYSYCIYWFTRFVCVNIWQVNFIFLSKLPFWESIGIQRAAKGT